MPIMRIRLRETTTTQGCANFAVNADTPEGAAAILTAAYHYARSANLETISLPDGQTGIIEPETLGGPTLSFHLLDDTGSEVRIILPNSNGQGRPG